MPNTLGLDDDLDPVEVLNSLQAAFGFKFTRVEADGCLTVGDVYNIVRNHCLSYSTSGNQCATAMAFYRLRRALPSLDLDRRPTPSVKLKEIARAKPKALFSDLAKNTGLRLPRSEAGILGQIGGCLLFVGILCVLGVVLSKWHFWQLSLVVTAAGFLLSKVDDGRYPRGCETLGGLAGKVAGLNFGKLCAAGAKPREKNIWNALVEVLDEYSLISKSEISEDTVLLSKHARSA